MAIGLQTFDDKTRHEDVVDLVFNVDYKSTPFTSRIGESVATNTYHEWLTDTYAAPAFNASAEGSDATIADLSAPNRIGNVVQLFRKVITVTDTEIAIPHYGQNDPFEYQTQKKLIESARDIELACIAGTRASGASGVARQMDGAIAQITSNKTAIVTASGATAPVFTEDNFNSLLGNVYNGGTDEVVDLILTGQYLKRTIDKFATNTVKYLDAEDFKQVLRVDVYQSSFGQHEICMERNIPAGAVLGIDSSKWRLAWLVNRRLAIRPLAKTGSSTKALLEGEATLEANAEKANFYATGYFAG